MSRTTACPEESQLLAFAAGSSDVLPTLRPHVESCPACRRSIGRLLAEIAQLRASLAPDHRDPSSGCAWGPPPRAD